MIIKVKKYGKTIWSDGSLQIWETVCTKQKSIYTVLEPHSGTLMYTTVYGTIEGCKVTPSQALALFRGESVEHCAKHIITGGSGEDCSEYRYPCTLVPAGIVTQETHKGGYTYYDQVLKVNVAWHLMHEKTNQVFAYRCDNQIFLKKRPGADFEAEISAADCFKLQSEGFLCAGDYRLPYEILESESPHKWKSGQIYSARRLQPEVLPELSEYQKELLAAANFDLEGNQEYLRRALMALGQAKFEELIANLLEANAAGRVLA